MADLRMPRPTDSGFEGPGAFHDTLADANEGVLDVWHSDVRYPDSRFPIPKGGGRRPGLWHRTHALVFLLCKSCVELVRSALVRRKP